MKKISNYVDTLQLLLNAHKKWKKYADDITFEDHKSEEFKLINEHKNLLKKINKQSHCLVKIKI